MTIIAGSMASRLVFHQSIQPARPSSAPDSLDLGQVKVPVGAVWKLPALESGAAAHVRRGAGLPRRRRAHRQGQMQERVTCVCHPYSNTLHYK